MMRNDLPRRGNRSAKHHRGRVFRKGGHEQLESRQLLTATPLGEPIALDWYLSTDAAVSAALPDGDSIVVFQADMAANRRASADNREIFLQRIGSSGTPEGDPQIVNQFTRGDQLSPALATAEDGSFLVVWSGRGAGDRVGVFAQRYDTSAMPVGDPLLVNTTVGGEQTNPDVAMAADGSAVIVWHGPGVDDAHGVWMRRVDAAGNFQGDQVRVNSTLAGEQAYPSVGIDRDGEFVVAWSSRGQDGSGWGIFAQRFSAAGSAIGGEFTVNTTTEGSQHHATVAMSPSGGSTIAWSSLGQDGDSWGIFAQQYDASGSEVGNEFAVNEQTAGHQRDVDAVMAEGGQLLMTWSDGRPDGSGWNVAARAFDASGNANGATLSVHGNASEPGNQRFAAVSLAPTGTALVTFDGLSAGNQPSVVARRFTIDVGPVENVNPRFNSVSNVTTSVGEEISVVVRATDANAQDTLTFALDTERVPAGSTIERIDNNSARIRWTPTQADRLTDVVFRALVDDDAGGTDAIQFTVSVRNQAPTVDLNTSVGGNNTSAAFDSAAGTVSLLDNQTTITDPDQVNLESATIRLRSTPDGTSERLVVDTAGTSITAEVYDASTGILQLSGSASVAEYQQVLRTLQYENSADAPTRQTRSVDITVNDGAAESPLATVTVSVDDNAPSFAPLPNVMLLAGSPLWISLDGTSPTGAPLTYSATAADSFVTTEIPTGNRSLRMEVENFGTMVFELFDDRAPRVTERITSLANNDFYDGLTFHRIINNFVIQGGDPRGDGTGGSDLGDFDDQYHVDLQHNRTGLISMAKSIDDTNDSQFFITEGPTRTLDSQHSIFGVLTEGESVRAAISDVATGSGDRPLSTVAMREVTVIDNDPENAALLLSAPEGTTGSTTVTVEVTDGNIVTTQTFTVTIVPDTSNSPPFLNDIPTIATPIDTPTTFTLTAQDVEGDGVTFYDQTTLSQFTVQQLGQNIPVQAPADLEYSVDPSTGVVTVTPRNGLSGTHRFTVAVAPAAGGRFDFQVVEIVIG